MTNNVDIKFIELQEGNKLQAYIPMQNNQIIGDSGITISIGIDLSKSSISDLASMGISSELIQLLSPYIGLTGNDAIIFLNNNPLTITSEQSDELANGELSIRYSKFAELYNEYTTGINFEDLDANQQSAIISLVWQYGNAINVTCPHYFYAVTTQNWNLAITILKNFGDNYENRRIQEAQLLINDQSN